ncbi:hypothetical protein C1H46_018599 [Malus baccata]|uniref:Uncharacterized protein n=1 Tax=Malus baccata TaxID=106549 RepID=A0A540MAJ7_MALBA|nr:hypothetical protein C1H46_018599 [Malus baccata]
MYLDRQALIRNWISNPLSSLTSPLPTGMLDLHRGRVRYLTYPLASSSSHMLLCLYIFAGFVKGTWI